MAKRSDKKQASGLPVLVFAGALVAALGLGVGLRYVMTDQGQDAGLVSASIGGPFRLTDHTGAVVTDKTYLGRYMLLYFGYTYCPDVCPTSLGTLVEALGRLPPEKAAKIKPVMITVDPLRDTQEKLAEYVQAFHPELDGLWGSEEDIAKTAKLFRVYYNKVKDDNPDVGYSLDHSSLIYLMGPDGRFVRYFTHGTSADDMAKALMDSVQ